MPSSFWLFKKGMVAGVPAFPTVGGDDATVRVSLEYEDQQSFLETIPDEHRDIFDFGFETGLRLASYAL